MRNSYLVYAVIWVALVVQTVSAQESFSITDTLFLQPSTEKALSHSLIVPGSESLLSKEGEKINAAYFQLDY